MAKGCYFYICNTKVVIISGYYNLWPIFYYNCFLLMNFKKKVNTMK